MELNLSQRVNERHPMSLLGFGLCSAFIFVGLVTVSQKPTGIKTFFSHPRPLSFSLSWDAKAIGKFLQGAQWSTSEGGGINVNMVGIREKCFSFHNGMSALLAVYLTSEADGLYLYQQYSSFQGNWGSSIFNSWLTSSIQKWEHRQLRLVKEPGSHKQPPPRCFLNWISLPS